MAMETIRGRVAWIFEEENFDVDQIVGVKNIKITDVAELSKLAMTSYDPDFASLVQAGDVVVGAGNFGYGHPHYPPLRALRHLGVAAVIAESFSPGFWRGEISMGTPLISCPGILGFVQRWDEIEVVWSDGVIRNRRTNDLLAFEALSVADREMLEYGGLLPYLKHAAQSAPA
jgi:3-isopropylmalate/(R)-2-methylmalate dehydratase small subunit